MLHLCHEHRQEPNQSQFDSDNCDYCNLYRQNKTLKGDDTMLQKLRPEPTIAYMIQVNDDGHSSEFRNNDSTMYRLWCCQCSMLCSQDPHHIPVTKQQLLSDVAQLCESCGKLIA